MSITNFLKLRGKNGQVTLCPIVKQLQDLREISKVVQVFLTVVPKLKGILIQFQNAVANKLLIHATTWMNLKSLMLSKRNLSQKPTYCTIPFI